MYDKRLDSFRCNAEVNGKTCHKRAKYRAKGVYCTLDYCERHKNRADAYKLETLPADHSHDPRFPR